ncbi:MAG TPA: ABC transporter substrate-binding protein [Anaeromyxobacteraceae bacterium]|nr:ABC transporter substrate-binding protein [Anaeromyxobacteraceae bacterium]
MLLLGACQREPIRVGGLFGLSGRNFDLGVSGRDGATLAVEDVNAAGGVSGRRLELVVRDDAQDPDTARRAIRELVDSGVVVVVGPMTSGMAEAVVPIANETHVLLVSPTTSAASLRGLDDWLVTLFPSVEQSAGTLVTRITGADGVLRLAVIHDLANRSFSGSWLEHVTRRVQASGGSVASVPFTSGPEARLGDVAERALSGSPGGVLVVAGALDSAAICQQIRKRDGKVRVYGTDWGFTAAALEHGGRTLEGAVFTYTVDPERHTQAFDRFVSSYRTRFSRPPDFAAAFAYESVQVAAAALRTDPSRSGVRTAILRTGHFPGLQEDIRIDRFGDAGRRQFLMTVRDGRIVTLE